MKEIFEKIKEKFKITSRSGNVDENVSRENILRSPKVVIAIVGCIVAVSILIIMAYTLSNDKEEIIYKETMVEFGELSVGITESSSVDMETTTQSFELDISALVKNESSNNNGSAQGQSVQSGQMGQSGPMGQSGQMGGGIQFPTLTGSGVSYSSQQADVTVEEIVVSVGQKVEKGTLLLSLTKDSVEDIRNQLETDLTEAKNDLNSIENEQRSSKLEAKQNYDSSVLYGKFAQTEYEEAIENEQDTVTELEESVVKVQETIDNYSAQLEELNAEYTEAVLYCTNITETLDSMDVSKDPAWFASLEGTRIEAQEFVYSLEKDIEQLQSNLEKSTEELENTTKNLEQARRNLELKKLSAKRDYDLRMLASNTAQESYDISIGYLEQEAAEQQKAYDSAKEKMEAFDNAISEYGIYASESGVITEISVGAGDSITTGTELVTMYTQNVNLTVTLEESDAENVTEESVVKVSLISYPDLIFEGIVSEIGDAQYDSSTGKSYYDITVSVEGNGVDFYQGMTGEVTFLTKETEEVTYVSNRAIFREGIKSYVKMKDDEGKIVKKEVVTGFSDGVNVEIIEGVSEGEIVLIESRVSDE